MLSSVAVINRALDSGDVSTVWRQLSNPVTGLTNIEDENCQRWVFWRFMSVFDTAHVHERFGFLPLILQVLSLLTPILIYSLSVLASCLCIHRFLLICSEYRLSDLYQGFTTKLCCGPTRFSIALGQLLPCVFCLKLSCGVLVLFLIVLHWSWPPCSWSFVFFLFFLSYMSVLTLVLLLPFCVWLSLLSCVFPGQFFMTWYLLVLTFVLWQIYWWSDEAESSDACRRKWIYHMEWYPVMCGSCELSCAWRTWK